VTISWDGLFGQRGFGDGSEDGVLSVALRHDRGAGAPVDAKGGITRPQVNSTLGDPVVAACILKSVKTWRFPARQGGLPAPASYKFALQ